MSDFNEMFNLDADDFKETSKDSVMYKVSPKNGKNGVYSSLIRFVPWYKDPKNSLVEKWESWLENPVSKKGVLVDCPSSIGKPSELMDIFWKLRNSSNQQMKDKAQYFSRKRKFWAIIQILKDDNRPELEGKLMVFKFGPKIYDKIQAELKPEYGVPHVPFHPFDGKPFHIKCKEVAGYPNYDESKFLDQPAPIMVEGKLLKKGSEAELMEFLKENSPNLDDFKFKEWTQEQADHFREMVSIILPSASQNAETLRKGTPTTAPIETPQPKTESDEPETTESGEISEEEDDMNFKFNLED